MIINIYVVLSLMIGSPTIVLAKQDMPQQNQTNYREYLGSWKVTLEELEWYIMVEQ